MARSSGSEQGPESPALRATETIRKHVGFVEKQARVAVVPNFLKERVDGIVLAEKRRAIEFVKTRFFWDSRSRSQGFRRNFRDDIVTFVIDDDPRHFLVKGGFAQNEKTGRGFARTRLSDNRCAVLDAGPTMLRLRKKEIEHYGISYREIVTFETPHVGPDAKASTARSNQYVLPPAKPAVKPFIEMGTFGWVVSIFATIVDPNWVPVTAAPFAGADVRS